MATREGQEQGSSAKANKAMQNGELTRPRACEEGDLQGREASVTLQKLALQRREACFAESLARQKACDAEKHAMLACMRSRVAGVL